MARPTKLQKLLIAYIRDAGGKHVYISRTLVPPADSGLRGYTWEGVNLSLKSLVRNGQLKVVRDSFFYLTPSKPNS
jgi:hypothetical protein